MSVSATFMPVILARKEALGNVETNKTGDKNENLGINFARVSYIQYPIIFQKQFILALFNSWSEVNTIYLTFAKKQGLSIRPIDVGVQKIDGIMLDTYEMVVAFLLMMDKVNWVKIFEKTFLVTNISLKVVFGIFFLNLSNTDVNFLD